MKKIDNVSEGYEYKDIKTIIKQYKKEIYIVAIISIVICAIFFVMWYKKEKDVIITEAKTGSYEIYTETKAYMVVNENVVQYDKANTLIPIAQSEKRITNGSVIGIYINEEYSNNLLKLEELDRQINNKIKLLPEIFSTDVLAIDKEIDEVTKEINSSGSYIYMNDFKTKLDNLAYKKALTVSSLTPSGTEVKNLILEREKFKNSMNKSALNVRANVSGILMYKVDGLENKYNLDIITEEKISNIILDYSKESDENFGIKIVDNYEGYLIIKEDKSNDKYIVEGRNYQIKLLDKDSSIIGNLAKKISKDNLNYCIFKINNGVENIAGLRKTDVKIVWKDIEGLIVNNSSIKTINNIDYVTILSLNKYIEIPVKTMIKLEKYSVVKNYSEKEKEELSISSSRELVIYDRVVEAKE